MNSSIWCASGAELSILATTIAIYISELYSSTDLNTISDFVEMLGDSLSLLAAQKNRCENSLNTNSSTIDNLYNQNKNQTQN